MIMQTEKSGKLNKIDNYYSAVLIKLMQGFLVSEDKKLWDCLLTHQERVREYFAVIGLSLHLNTDDGYAFLKTFVNHINEDSDALEELEEEPEFPSLVRRFPLSFDVSLLCVLLREALEQFDAKVSDDHRLIMHQSDIYDLLKLFYEDKTDETKQIRKFDALINKVQDLGFLKELKGNSNTFEVRRIIKAQFDAEKLNEIKIRMRMELGLKEQEGATI